VPERAAEGFVLAGGHSSRMGQDKALIQFDKHPLIVHAVEILRRAGLSVSIAGARSSLAEFAPVIEDGPDGDKGPLSGICAALAAGSSQYAVFLPIDLPLLPSSLIVFMLHHAQITDSFVTLASLNGFAQTFPAVVDRTILPSLQQRLSAGELGCFNALTGAARNFNQHLRLFHVEHLIQMGQVSHPQDLPPALWFLNVNTPVDLARAKSIPFARHRVV
jgi:molybdopterin-guanine dinucleotide biosynthesis protein A